MNERWLVQPTFMQGFAIRSDTGALIASNILFQDVAEHIVKLHNDAIDRADEEAGVHKCGWIGCIEYIRIEDLFCFPHAVRAAMQNAFFFQTPTSRKKYEEHRSKYGMEES